MTQDIERRLARLERSNAARAATERPVWAPQRPVEDWTPSDIAAVQEGVQRAALAGRARPLAWMRGVDLLTLQARLRAPLAGSAGLEVSP